MSITSTPRTETGQGRDVAQATSRPCLRPDTPGTECGSRQATRPGNRVDDVLARADGVELLGELPGSGYQRPPRWYVVPMVRPSS